MALHRWLSGGSGGSSRVSAWILNPAAAAAAKISAMMIQVIGRTPSNLYRPGAPTTTVVRARPAVQW
jgi:hypothetical protein